MELVPALREMRRVLRPGGRLAVLGLHRMGTPLDYAFACLAVAPNLVRTRILDRGGEGAMGMTAPAKPPDRDARRDPPRRGGRAAGARVHRHVYWRYSLSGRRGSARSRRDRASVCESRGQADLEPPLYFAVAVGALVRPCSRSRLWAFGRTTESEIRSLVVDDGGSQRAYDLAVPGAAPARSRGRSSRRSVRWTRSGRASGEERARSSGRRGTTPHGDCAPTRSATLRPARRSPQGSGAVPVASEERWRSSPDHARRARLRRRLRGERGAARAHSRVRRSSASSSR